MSENLGIYIHIPFCKQKCYYCDFVSYCNKDNFIEKYVQCLLREIDNKRSILRNIKSHRYENCTSDDEIVLKRKVDTIYIGGGTPSYIDSKYIKQILDEIRKNFVVNQDAEITIEINPGTVDGIEKLKQYKEAGINRISIGLQSTENRLLKQIGRIHNLQEFLDTYNLVKQVGFENINVDLMIGLPNQNISDIKSSLEKIIKLEPNHISVYSLIVEDGTPICKMLDSGELELPNEELERNMYWYVKNTLELNGFKHYEISNFAKKGYESKHNINCWEQNEYLGFGEAAHSYFENVRFSNIYNLENYIKNICENNLNNNVIIHEKQSREDIKKEYMLLNLRKIDGVEISKFKIKFGDNPIFYFRKELNKLIEEELVQIDGDYIKLTNKGLDLANLVWEEFV